jgi:hypothetical protein
MIPPGHYGAIFTNSRVGELCKAWVDGASCAESQRDPHPLHIDRVPSQLRSTD